MSTRIPTAAHAHAPEGETPILGSGYLTVSHMFKPEVMLGILAVGVITAAAMFLIPYLLLSWGRFRQ